MSRHLRIFSLAEANALLGRLSASMERMTACLRAIESSVQGLRLGLGDAAPGLDADPSDPVDVRECKSDVRRLLAVLRKNWDDVEMTGAVLEDIRGGLVDFRTRHRGEIVWLCWRFGESEVGHWHGMQGGFAARKTLETIGLARRLN